MNGCILLFGMPRSGTSWIGKLFDSHPDTLYRHEPDSVRHLQMPWYPDRGDAPRYRAELERFLAEVPAMRSPEVVGKQPLFPKNYQSAIGLAAYRASVVAAKAASLVHRHFPCPYRPTAVGYAGGRLVWKSIESLGRLGVCIDALPDARAIHIMRHPCGYVASVLRGSATGQFAAGRPVDRADFVWPLKPLLQAPVGQAHGLASEDLADLAPEELLAWRWTLVHEKAKADGLAAGRTLIVRYEDVCANPVEMTRKMFAFAGLGWQAQTETFVQQSTHHPQKNYYSVFKNPMASAERWHSELASTAIDRVMAILEHSSLRELYGDPVATEHPRAEVAS